MPRCKNCKEKFEPVRFNQRFCLNPECVKVWVSEAKDQSWKKTKKKMQSEIETVQELMKAAQIVFNKFIRIRDKDQPCISCGSKLENKFDAGHYFSQGQHSALRFNELIVNLCCRKCNYFLSGNLINYRNGLIKKYGEQRVLLLESSARRSVKKWSRFELEAIIQQYKL